MTLPARHVFTQSIDYHTIIIKAGLICLLALLPQLAPAQARPRGVAAKAISKQPVDYVNVFTGTSNSRWALFPGPKVPFGMVRLSPDNQGQVWTAGYEYTVSSISGFSHLHAFGLSGLSVMPATGHLENLNQTKTYPGEPDGPFGTMWTAGYRSRFDKRTEHAAPGYYGVELLDARTKVELTSTTSDSFWGTQWNLTPLMTLVTPAKANSWVNSFLALYDTGGWMPDAPVGLEYSP